MTVSLHSAVAGSPVLGHTGSSIGRYGEEEGGRVEGREGQWEGGRGWVERKVGGAEWEQCRRGRVEKGGSGGLLIFDHCTMEFGM